MGERLRIPQPSCTCTHPPDCDCACHGRYCDPTEQVCLIEYLADEGGLARWGCPGCTPGEDAAHFGDCAAAVDWSVPAASVPVVPLGSL